MLVFGTRTAASGGGEAMLAEGGCATGGAASGVRARVTPETDEAAAARSARKMSLPRLVDGVDAGRGDNIGACCACFEPTRGAAVAGEDAVAAAAGAVTVGVGTASVVGVALAALVRARLEVSAAAATCSARSRSSGSPALSLDAGEEERGSGCFAALAVSPPAPRILSQGSCGCCSCGCCGCCVAVAVGVLPHDPAGGR